MKRHFLTVNVVPVEFIRKKRQEGYEKKFYEISLETFVDENLRASNKTFTTTVGLICKLSQPNSGFFLVINTANNFITGFKTVRIQDQFQKV